MKDAIKAVKQHILFFAAAFLLLLSGSIFLAAAGKRSTFLFFNTYHTVWADTFFTYYTNFGDGIFAILLGLFYFFLLRKKKTGIALIIAYASSGILSVLIKNLVTSPRPKAFFGADEYTHFIEGVTHTGFSSMPSGHTTTAFAIATVLVLMNKHAKWQLPLLVAAAMVGFSRMYLAQHFFGDVLAGALLGMVCAIPCANYASKIDTTKLTFKKRQLHKSDGNISSKNSTHPS